MFRSAALSALALVFAAALPARAQAFKPKKSKLPDAEVDAAVNKGIAWLKRTYPEQVHTAAWAGVPLEEMVLYTFHLGGLSREDPTFQSYLRRVVDKDPEKTYGVACAAMCLVDLDKVGYQWKLAHYAQFLADTQCKNGQWGYGEPMKFDKPAGVGAQEPAKAVETGAAPPAPRPPGALYGTVYPAKPAGEGGKSATTVARMRINARRRGIDKGDNSNSQYAALALRACAEAGIQVDSKCLQDALQWWASNQNGDGGWGYAFAGDNDSRGSMTVGGVGAIAIYDWLLHVQWRADPKLLKGLKWLNTTWDLADNPRANDWSRPFQYYYLYGLERTGMLVGTDAIGTHDWYDEGGAYLLKGQNAEGWWASGRAKKDDERDAKVWDTCFAILYLRRATKALSKVYTQQ